MYYRHGADMHYMRPDAVMRTSVVQPSGGYYPTADVLAVANEFTVGNYAFSQGNVADDGMPTSGMSGLGYTYFRGLGQGGGPSFNPFKKLWLMFKAKRAAAKAQMFVAAATARGMRGLGAAYPYGPAMAMGPMINPDAAARFSMLTAMAERNMPMSIADSYGPASLNRWNTVRFPNG